MVAILDEYGRAHHGSVPDTVGVQKSAMHPLYGNNHAAAYDMYRLALMGNGDSRMQWAKFASANPSGAAQIVEWHQDMLITSREHAAGAYDSVSKGIRLPSSIAGLRDAASGSAYHYDPAQRTNPDKGRSLSQARVDLLREDLNHYDPAVREAAFASLKKLQVHH